MTVLEGLIAYPSDPNAVGSTIKSGIEILNLHGSRLKSWEENEIAGYFIDTPILDDIEKGNVLVADITRLNFNVAYEIGYGIGKKKRIILICNESLVGDKELILEVGIFDTL